MPDITHTPPGTMPSAELGERLVRNVYERLHAGDDPPVEAMLSKGWQGLNPHEGGVEPEAAADEHLRKGFSVQAFEVLDFIVTEAENNTLVVTYYARVDLPAQLGQAPRHEREQRLQVWVWTGDQWLTIAYAALPHLTTTKP